MDLIWDINCYLGLSGSSNGQESVCNAGDPGSNSGSERSPGERKGNPLQYSCLENPMDRGAWQAPVNRVTRVGHDLATKPPPTCVKPSLVWLKKGVSSYQCILLVAFS